MPYKDPDQRKKYQRSWCAARRALYLQDKHCRKCAERGLLTTANLEIDHINPKEKWTHRVWSHSWTKIMKEMSKCQVLCTACHYEKTMTDGSEKTKYRGPSYS